MNHPAETARRTKLRHLPLVAVGLTAALCVAALLGRDALYARWWAHRLAQSESPFARAGYIVRLGSMGGAARWAVSALGSDRRPDVRQAAALVAQQVPDAWATATLLDLAADPDGDVRQAAAVALAQRRDERAIPALQAAFRVGDDVAAGAVAMALATLGTRSAALAAVELAYEPARPAQLAALAEALGQIGDPVGVPALRHLQGDDRPLADVDEEDAEPRPRTVGAAATQALERLAGGHGPSFEETGPATDDGE